MSKAKKKQPFLVVIKLTSSTEKKSNKQVCKFFEFPTRKDQKAFVAALEKKKLPNITWALTL